MVLTTKIVTKPFMRFALPSNLLGRCKIFLHDCVMNSFDKSIDGTYDLVKIFVKLTRIC